MTTTHHRTTTPTATWTGTPAQLHKLLRPVLVHAGTDDALPVLLDVQVEARDRSLFLAATDRYSLGVARVDLDTTTDAPVELTVNAKVLRSAATSAGRGTRTTMRLDITPAALTLTYTHPAAGVDADPVSLRIPASPTTMTFPDWRALIAKTMNEGLDADHTGSAFNPAYLARFQHAAEPGEPIILHGTGRGRHPAVITARDHFIGLLMPVTVIPADATNELHHWTEITGTRPAARAA